MRIQFVGSGDAFGSGGRFNTCFQVTAGSTRLLLDCGATSLVALNKLGIDRNAIDLILLTHFHADHCGGVPFFVLDAQFVSRRLRPLTIAGPVGLAAWFPRLMDTAFAGSSRSNKKFDVQLVELAPEVTWEFGDAQIRPTLVRHGPPPDPCHGYRIASGGQALAYTGDTEWTDNLLALGRDADLLVSEASVYDKPVPFHLAYRTLVEHLPAIRPKRLILTHMGEDMLGRGAEIAHERADDGMVVEI